jgi:hypothetical protein
MTRCAGSQGTGFACMVAGMPEPLDAARSVCAVVSALAGQNPTRSRLLISRLSRVRTSASGGPERLMKSAGVSGLPRGSGSTCLHPRTGNAFHCVTLLPISLDRPCKTRWPSSWAASKRERPRRPLLAPRATTGLSGRAGDVRLRVTAVASPLRSAPGGHLLIDRHASGGTPRDGAVRVLLRVHPWSSDEG